MSLKLNREPGEISLSGNPMYYEIQSDIAFDSVPYFPGLAATFGILAPTGSFFGFYFIDPDSGQRLEIRFQADPAPDDSGRFFIDNSFVGTLAQYVEAVFNQIKNNALMASYFDISYDGSTTINFTAKQPIEELTPIDVFQSAGFVNLVVEDLVNTPEKRPNFKVLLEVFVEQTFRQNDYVSATVLQGTSDDQGRVLFDIQDIIHTQIQNSFETPPIPDVNDLATHYKQPTLRRYYVRFAESFGLVSEVRQWIYSEKRTAMHGCVSEEDFPKADFFQFYQSKKLFLNLHPDKKEAGKDQPEFLSFMNFTNVPVAVKAWYKVFYNDGSSSIEVVFNATAFDLDRWETVVFPVGYEQLDLSTLEIINKDIVAWELVVKDDGGTELTERRRFVLDFQFNTCPHTMVFLNSLCVPEVIRTKGEWREDLGVARSFAKKALNPDYTVINGREYQFDSTGTDVLQARSGYLSSREVAKWWKDNLLGRPTFLLEGKDWIPVVVDGSSFEITECRRFLHVFDFVARRTFEKNCHSVVARIPEFFAVEDCGLLGFVVEDNGCEIRTFENLNLYEEDRVTLIESIVHDPLDGYELTTKETLPRMINVRGELELTTGEVLKYDFDFEIKNEVASWTTSDPDAHGVLLQATETIPVYIDWGDGTPLQTFSVGTVTVGLTHVYTIAGPKRVRVFTPCFDKIVLWAHLATAQIDEFILPALPRLQSFVDLGTGASGTLNFFSAGDLVTLGVPGNNYDVINMAFHVNLETVDVSSNNLDRNRIEDIVFTLWKFRKKYTFAGSIFLDISNNPVLPLNYTNRTIDCLIGSTDTGQQFAGEGLITDYGWTVVI